MCRYDENLSVLVEEEEPDEYFIEWCKNQLESGSDKNSLNLYKIECMYAYTINHKLCSPLAREVFCLYNKCFK